MKGVTPEELRILRGMASRDIRYPTSNEVEIAVSLVNRGLGYIDAGYARANSAGRLILRIYEKERV